MATALPTISTISEAVTAGTGLYNAVKGQPTQQAQPVNLGQKTQQIRTVSNPFLSTKYKTSTGYVRGK